jgi:hypothetical protein
MSAYTLFRKIASIQIRSYHAGSGSRAPLNPDPDPQHWPNKHKNL